MRTRTSFWWIHVNDIKSRTASGPLPSLSQSYLIASWWARRLPWWVGKTERMEWHFSINLFSTSIVYWADEKTALNEHTSLGQAGVARVRRRRWRSHHNNTILKLEHKMFAQFWYPLNLEKFILERPSMNAIWSVWIFRCSWLFYDLLKGPKSWNIYRMITQAVSLLSLKIICLHIRDNLNKYWGMRKINMQLELKKKL